VKEGKYMKYRLGCYEASGNMECLRTIVGGNEEAKEKARRAYNLLKEVYKCTIWVQKCEYVDPEEEFK
jgi:hypothetical protein